MVFSATSVSISVAVLKEAGLLDSKEGVSILGAAVADDVIGVILLSVMCTLVNTGSVDVAGLGLILLKQVLFFVAAAVVVPILAYLGLSWEDMTTWQPWAESSRRPSRTPLSWLCGGLPLGHRQRPNHRRSVRQQAGPHL